MVLVKMCAEIRDAYDGNCGWRNWYCCVLNFGLNAREKGYIHGIYGNEMGFGNLGIIGSLYYANVMFCNV